MNISVRNIAIAAGTLVAISLSSCTDKKWYAEGTVSGAEGKEMILEAPNHFGQWYALDTIEIDSHGKFKVSHLPAGHPEVYRLTLGKESAYFPIDSIEKITITADAGTFSNRYTLAGSQSAEKMQKVNDLIAKVVAEQGEQAVAYDPALKRALAETILSDPSGIVAYYTIFRRVGDPPLFNPEDKSDLKMIGAVANAFTSRRPADPRTAYLSQFYLANRRANGVRVAADTIVAQEITLPEIALLDREGKERSLTQEASKGKVMILNFTAYSAEFSPAVNLELAKIYNANKDAGIEIYQVSVDSDEFTWKQAAANIPWIAVFNSPKHGAKSLLQYNVTNLPATFVINRKGELVERVDDLTRLSSAVARYL